MLTATMTINIGQFTVRLTSLVDDRAVLPMDTSRPSPCSTDFGKVVNSNLLAGEVTVAVRIITSDDCVITPTAEVVTTLRLKYHRHLSTCVRHQQGRYHNVGCFEGRSNGRTEDVSSEQRMWSRRTAARESTHSTNSRGRTAFVESSLQSLFKTGTSQIPQHTRDILFAANLTGLQKKNGGIRIIVVGNIFCRLASNIAAKRVMPDLRSLLPPIQLSVGVSDGCEAVAHAVRAFVQSLVVPVDNILVKLDMKNAFNAVRRDHFLVVCSSRAPSNLRIALSGYATSSHLVIANGTIISEAVVQQGDPLGSVLFAK